MNNDKIDFVLIWVDGGDIEWQKERNKHAGKNPEDLADYRFRDWDNLKYWFRGVEKFAPWVNNVYFITCGHYPKWLNLNNPKLKFVKHEDYIPKDFLPTFNSHTIELNLHRIESLSNHFVYFNDDTFIIDDVKQEDFFENNFPKHVAGLDILKSSSQQFGHIIWNDTFFINKRFSKKSIFKNNLRKWLSLKNGTKNVIGTLLLMPFNVVPCFKNMHNPVPIVKETIKLLWKNDEDIFVETSKDKFRSSNNINQYVFSWYELAKGNFKPANRKNYGYYDVANDIDEITKTIINKNRKMICINDGSNDFDFDIIKNKINEAFEKLLPEKSSFEL